MSPLFMNKNIVNLEDLTSTFIISKKSTYGTKCKKQN